MNTHEEKTSDQKSRAVANNMPQTPSGPISTFGFVDNRPEMVAQRKFQEMANRHTLQKKPLSLNTNNVSHSPLEDRSEPIDQSQLRPFQPPKTASIQADALQTKQLKPFKPEERESAQTTTSQTKQLKPFQPKPNNTGLPDQLKSGIENLSGYSMDDVKVHYNSDKPAQLNAHAYAQGTDIHVASGQEKHLSHEAWHVVQQKQGRVRPTMQMKEGVSLNENVGLENEADLMGNKALRVSINNIENKIKGRDSNIAPIQRKLICKTKSAIKILKDLSPGTQIDESGNVVSVGNGAAAKYINELINSKYTWCINDSNIGPYTEPNDNVKAENGVGSGGTIYIPPLDDKVVYGTALVSGELEDTPNVILLGHELCGHAFLINKGEHGKDTKPRRGMGGHQASVAAENELREAAHMKLRGGVLHAHGGESYTKEPNVDGLMEVKWSREHQICAMQREDFEEEFEEYNIKSPIENDIHEVVAFTIKKVLEDYNNAQAYEKIQLMIKILGFQLKDIYTHYKSLGSWHLTQVIMMRPENNDKDKLISLLN